MYRSILTFSVGSDIAWLQLADYPQSHELSEALERLRVERFDDLRQVSVLDLRRVSRAAHALTLELGCLIRRAKRAEFGKLPGDSLYQHAHEDQWRTRPGDVPGKSIAIPKAVRKLPLSVFDMPVRLRNILNCLGFTQAGDLQGREYRGFLRVAGVGAKTLDDLRKLVQQIRQCPLERPSPPPEKTTRAPRCFAIPEALENMDPYGLPLSARLDGVLRRMGITRLGEPQGMEFCEMHMMAGCGPKTLKEILRLIEQVLAGGFAA